MKGRHVLFACLPAVFALLFTSGDLPSCGPSFEGAVFSDSNSPMISLKEYAAGRLGIIHSTYYRTYLLIAYRFLSDRPLSMDEQKSLLGEGSESRWVQSGSFYEPEVVKNWREARAKISGVQSAGALEIYRKLASFQWSDYLNCTEDAYRNAASTLRQRIQTFGANHRGVREWVNAQDIVFSNCAEGKAIPPPAEDGLPELLRADRDYQIAAAYFYSEDFDEAVGRFRAISASKSSPWNKIAGYIAARCLIRKSTLSEADSSVKLALLSDAEKQLQSFLADDRGKEMHGAAKKLLDFIAVRLRPKERIRTIAQDLQNGGTYAAFGQKLIDFRYLLDHAFETGDSSLTEPCASSDLCDWILTMPSQGDAALSHSLQRWKETKGAQWLVSSAVRIGADHPEAPRVIAAASEVPQSSPAYATVTYHRIRLLRQRGQTDEPRRILDDLLPGLRLTQPRSALNLFLQQRMELAQSLDEFLRYAPRRPAGMSYSDESYPLGPEGPEWKTRKDAMLFDADSVKIFNQGLPLALLRRATTSPRLPSNLRQELVMMTWVRAILLENHAAARAVSADLVHHFPDLNSYLDTYLSASDRDAQRFAAAYLLLKSPQLKPYLKSGFPTRRSPRGIDSLRENWWCSFGAEGDLDIPAYYRFNSSATGRGEGATPRKEPVFPGFLMESEREALRAEWERLLKLDSAPNYLGDIVTRWARKNPNDPRAPEALHLVVKATRFGCTNQQSGRYSREAFQLLHRNYPASLWAKQTPFWYR